MNDKGERDMSENRPGGAPNPWRSHEDVKRDIEHALDWLDKCEMEQTTAYVHDAVGHLIPLLIEVADLGQDFKMARSEASPPTRESK